METGLYIITHKKVKNIYPYDRKIMMVGAESKNVPDGYCTDFDLQKDNISSKNRNYCELTGLYFMMKHDTSDVLSLEHYRRLFIKSRVYLFRYPFFKKRDIKKILKNYDIILPKKAYHNKSIYEEYSDKHYGSDLDKIRKILLKFYPDYLEGFDKCMAGNSTFLFNMFIAKRDIVSDYSNWLFDVLFKLEQQIDVSERDAYQQRVFGFLSERLLTVYIMSHRDIKVKEARVQMVECSAFMSQVKRVLNKIKKILHIRKGE